jgi:hypothetical protein
MIVHLLQRTLPHDSTIFTCTNVQASPAFIRDLADEGYYLRDTCEIPGAFEKAKMGIVLYTFVWSYYKQLGQEQSAVSVLHFEEETHHFVEKSLNKSADMIEAMNAEHPLHAAVIAAKRAGETLAAQFCLPA